MIGKLTLPEEVDEEEVYTQQTFKISGIITILILLTFMFLVLLGIAVFC